MASNDSDSGICDPQGQFDDWIEIYNSGDVAVDIGGMYLTDDLEQPTKWRLPENSPSETTITARGYLIIWADKDTSDDGLHADFKLDANGEQVGLFDRDGVTLVDSLVFGQQVAHFSYGSYPDANMKMRLFLVPTPGTANNLAYVDLVEDPEFSHERGFL